MNTLLLAVEGGGFHAPSLRELFLFDPWFGEGTLFAFNRTALLMLLSAVIVSGLLIVAFGNAKVVPGKLQAAMEVIVEFIREQIARPTMGSKGLKYVPFLTALFLFIWMNNLYEILPFVNYPTTSRMAIPAFLAIVVWSTFIFVGIKNQGLAYFKNAIIPPGVPGPILLLVIPIELVSTFVVRPLTLAVRLFANMMAGHILLAIIFIAANAFLVDVHDLPNVSFNLKGSPVGLIALAAGPALVAFELLVGVLQAYIFTILTGVYIGSSIEAHH